MKLWTYRWHVSFGGRDFSLQLAAGTKQSNATLTLNGAVLARDELRYQTEPYRLQVLTATLDGREYRFELGPHSWWSYGLRASVDGVEFHRTHDEPFAMLPRMQQMSERAAAQRAGQGDVDLGKLKRNAPAIATDIALGVLFFVVAKFTDLRTAALIAAAAGIALYPVQWALRKITGRDIDLLGGLALFGIVMLLLSAGFSWLLDSEFAVQMKATVLGGLAASFFAVDAARGSPYLGKRLALYIAYRDIDPQRLAWIFAGIGATMAGVNLFVALAFSKDVWLWYTLWGDFVLTMGLVMWLLPKARRPLAVA